MLNESWRSRKLMDPLLLRWSTLHLQEERVADINHCVTLWRLCCGRVWRCVCGTLHAPRMFRVLFWLQALSISFKYKFKIFYCLLSDNSEAKLRIVYLVLQRKLFGKFRWSWIRVHFSNRNVWRDKPKSQVPFHIRYINVADCIFTQMSPMQQLWLKYQYLELGHSELQCRQTAAECAEMW